MTLPCSSILVVIPVLPSITTVKPFSNGFSVVKDAELIGKIRVGIDGCEKHSLAITAIDLRLEETLISNSCLLIYYLLYSLSQQD